MFPIKLKKGEKKLVQNQEYRKQHARSLYLRYCNEQKVKKDLDVLRFINYIYEHDLHTTREGLQDLWRNKFKHDQKRSIATLLKMLVVCDVLKVYFWEECVFYEPKQFKPDHVHLICECGRMWEYGGDALKDFATELMKTCGAVLQAPAFHKVICPSCRTESSSRYNSLAPVTS